MALCRRIVCPADTTQFQNSYLCEVYGYELGVEWTRSLSRDPFLFLTETPSLFYNGQVVGVGLPSPVLSDDGPRW